MVNGGRPLPLPRNQQNSAAGAVNHEYKPVPVSGNKGGNIVLDFSDDDDDVGFGDVN